MKCIRPVVAGTVAWVLGVAAATSVGLVALSLIGAGLSDQSVQPVSPHVLGQPLGTAPAATGGAGVPATPSSPSRAADQTLSTAGGTIIASCRPTGAYLVGWSPAPGYRAQEITRGPAEAAKLKFDGDDREIEISIQCVNGVPRPKIEIEDDHKSGD